MRARVYGDLDDPASNVRFTVGAYAPTLPEILIAAGVISVGVLIFMVLCNKLVAGDAAAESVSLPADEAVQTA